MSEADVEIIVRGVLVDGGRLLVCHTKGAGNTYLPGGHVDFGEGTAPALQREMAEELGVDVVVTDFLGVCEHAFVQEGQPHHEINLIFAMTAEGFDSGRSPESREDYIEFFWLELEKLPSSTLEPASLRGCLENWISCAGEKCGWASGGGLESR